MYLYGKGVAQDHKEAARWARKAADQGKAVAQCHLGLMYQMGEGVTQNYKEAARWIGKAASQGHVDAQEALSIISQND